MTRLAVILSCVLLLSAAATSSHAQLVFEATSGECCLFTCPRGDGERLDASGCPILLKVFTEDGDPVSGLQADQFRLVSCSADLPLAECANGLPEFIETSPGVYEFIGAFGSGGYSADGLMLVVNGQRTQICLPITVVSVDSIASGSVNLADVGAFATDIGGTVPYNPRSDMNCDGVINLEDLATLGIGLPTHIGHSCTLAIPLPAN